MSNEGHANGKTLNQTTTVTLSRESVDLSTFGTHREPGPIPHALPPALTNAAGENMQRTAPIVDASPPSLRSDERIDREAVRPRAETRRLHEPHPLVIVVKVVSRDRGSPHTLNLAAHRAADSPDHNRAAVTTGDQHAVLESRTVAAGGLLSLDPWPRSTPQR